MTPLDSLPASLSVEPCRPVTAHAIAATQSTLVLGIGNTLLGDDGVGVHVMERLRTECGDDAGAFVDGGTLCFNLLANVEDASAILVIDAADLDAAPGTLRVFEGAAMDRFMKIPRRRSVHEIGLIDLFDMARMLDCLPERRALICIQPQSTDWSAALTPPVAAAADLACAEAAAVLLRWSAT